MAAPELSFEHFLGELAAQRGTTRKLRLAARYWSKLKRLPAAEREQVALALGSEVAWKQLERLFLRDGTLSDDEATVQQALDRLGNADPTELRRWAQVLRSGDRRKVSELVATAVQAALEQEAEEAAADPDAAGGPGEAPVDAATEPAAERDAPAADEPRSSGADGGGTAAAIDVRAAVAPATGAVAVPAAEPTAGAAAVPAVARDSVPPVAPPVDSRRAPADDVAAAAAIPTPVIASSPAGWPDPALRRQFARHGALSAALDHAPRPSARERLRELRELHRNPAGVAALGVAGRAELVARLGPGWAARRAVSEMIRSGSVAGVDEALRLIEGLDTAARRSWCLSVLVDSFTLTAAECQRVLQAAPSAAARRRLASRAAGGTAKVG